MKQIDSGNLVARCKKSWLTILLLLPIFLFAQDAHPYFLSQPCLTPDGQTVIFSFEGDLWKADVKSGQATRLTAMQGYETNAKVSPDGQWIAFTGRQYGNPDVFLMSMNGGEIKQLTHNASSDIVSSWSWDSKYIYFTNSGNTRMTSYKVSIGGGTPQKVFGDYFFLYDHSITEHPSSGELFFNDTWESIGSGIQRKRYKGPFNPDIQSYNPTTKIYKRYTDWIGKDFGATIDKSGNIYFISDEANGEFNLYTFDHDKKMALTSFPTSIKNASINSNGGKLVFEKDYELWLFDVATKQAEKLMISIARNNVLPKEKDFDVKGKISAFDISPDGKKAAFISRGELFVSDVDGKFIEHHETGSEERASEVKWLSDNKTLVFNQTLDGYLNIYTISADGNTPVKKITGDKRNNRSLILNKKRTMAVYLSGRDEVRLLDAKTFESKLLVKDEIWGFENTDPGFSPNDEWIVFGAYRNFEQDIMIYNIKEYKTINLTNTAVTETSPVWGPDGKYIYFVSSRLKPGYPMGLQDPRIYRLPLQKLSEPFRSDKFNDLFKEEKKEDKKDDSKDKKKSDKKGDEVKKDTLVIIKIDATKIMERIEQIGPEFGSQYLATVLQKDDKTTVLFNSNHAEGKTALYKTVLEPFEEAKTEKIAGSDGNTEAVAEADGKFYVLLHGTIQKLNLEANKLDPVNMSFTFRRNLSGEFSQMFYEAWAQLEQNYYDEHFHGIDWARTRDFYKQFLPYLNNRNDLRILLNDMLGELNSSHQGFYSGGDDEHTSLTNTTMESGVLFENDRPFRVKYILPRSAADKAGIDILPGDVLVKVNGVSVDTTIDRDYYFTMPSLDKELTLTFKRSIITKDVKLHPEENLSEHLYDQWIDANQKRVDEKSNRRIAYSHMKNMGQGEFEHFIIDMTEQLTNRDALILDLRYNTGGNVHDQVLNFLSQKSYLQWKYREGKLTRQPNFAPSDKPIILLTNEQSLSDAEMTSQGFKALKLGKIVGNETYHWIIFTSGAGLVDGSFVRLPSWGCYTLEGKDIEFNGVAPDIRVINTFEDKINGRDPQLDRAIDEILKDLK